MKKIEKNSLLQAALETTPTAVTIADARVTDMPLVFVNQAFTDITGFTAKESLNKNCRFLQGPETDPLSIEKIRQAIKKEEKLSIELLNYKKDGSPFWNLLEMSPVFDSKGRLRAYCGFQSDITEHKRSFETLKNQQKMESLGLMAGGMAHEMNNQLQSIVGMSRMVQKQIKDPDVSEMLEEILNSAFHSAEIIQVLLRFASRNQSFHQKKYIAKDYKVREAVDRIIRASGSVLPPSVDIRLHCPGLRHRDKLPVPHRLNETDLTQILMNLIINAADAMDRKGQIDISLQADEESLTIQVRDYGHGITLKDQKKIFEPFYTTKENGTGTGLGLVIVSGLVSQAGGKISLESEKGKGSCFTIKLPASHKKEAEQANDSQTPPPNNKNEKGERHAQSIAD